MQDKFTFKYIFVTEILNLLSYKRFRFFSRGADFI